MKFGACLMQVMYDKYSGRSRRFAFVTMSSVEDANAAIEKLNDTVTISAISIFFLQYMFMFIIIVYPYISCGICIINLLFCI